MADQLSFPIARTAPPKPPEIYHKFRLEGPLTKVKMWDGSEAWLITHYKDVRAALTDKRLSESPKWPGYPMLSPARKMLAEGDTMLPMTSGDYHLRLRRVLTRLFTVKRVEAQRLVVRKLVNDLIDEMIAEGGPLDFVSKFALQVPMRTISAMLGVPDSDQKFLTEKRRDRVRIDAAAHVPLEATHALAAYFDRILLEREKNLTDADDILMRLARDHVATGEISHEEAVALAYQVVQGGHETTQNTTALGVLLLLMNPDQLKALKENPALVSGAVEEMLRYPSIIQFSIARVAIEDLEIGGQPIRKGEGVFALLAAANHDPEIFPDPDKFDIHRNDKNHVAFSYGPHQCIGQQLARLELNEIFSVLFERLPNLRLAVPFESLQFKSMEMNFGVETMPVIW